MLISNTGAIQLPTQTRSLHALNDWLAGRSTDGAECSWIACPFWHELAQVQGQLAFESPMAF